MGEQGGAAQSLALHVAVSVRPLLRLRFYAMSVALPCSFLVMVSSGCLCVQFITLNLIIMCSIRKVTKVTK